MVRCKHCHGQCECLLDLECCVCAGRPGPRCTTCRQPRLHHLKTWPQFFEAISSGAKTFELRRNDRPFAVGDTLVLQEWVPETEGYTGAEERRVVTYIMRSGFGLPAGYCIMSLAREG